MKYFNTIEKSQLYYGDNLEVMDDLPAYSIDLIVTDPPYNFTKDDDLHLMQTYGFVSGDILTLGQEYVSSKGQETDYSRQKREELERIFSCKTWEVSE